MPVAGLGGAASSCSSVDICQSAVGLRCFVLLGCTRRGLVVVLEAPHRDLRVAGACVRGRARSAIAGAAR